MSEAYQIIDKKETQRLAAFLAEEGQALLPLVSLVEQAQLAVEDLMDVIGRAGVEAVLSLSAKGVTGEPHPGKLGGEVRRHGSQGGRVTLKGRKLKVRKPRLRRRGQGRGGEVEVPAYAAMQADPGLGERMLDLLMRGVSTRNYAAVLPELAETVGVSKSAVSRESIEAAEQELRRLCERRFEDIDLLILYLDGLRFGEHHVLVAVGVDAQGQKHVLGLRSGASENATVVTALLEELVERGVRPGRRRLFVIDGSKALRAAIERVYGADNPVQRCRNHKVKNVMDHLPEELRAPVKATMQAAWRLEPKAGIGRLRKQAKWLEVEHPDAAASLLEGLEEIFTVNRLGLPPSLRRCLVSTNLIESPCSGVRMRTRRVGRWRDGAMVKRWAASAFLATQKNFRRLDGYRDLWILQAALDEPRFDTRKEVA